MVVSYTVGKPKERRLKNDMPKPLATPHKPMAQVQKWVFIKYVFNIYQWKALEKEISKRVLTCPIHCLPSLKMSNGPRMTQNDHEPKNVGNLIESRFETWILTPLCYPKQARVLLKTEVELSVMLLFLFPYVDVVARLCRKSDLESFTSRQLTNTFLFLDIDVTILVT